MDERPLQNNPKLESAQQLEFFELMSTPFLGIVTTRKDPQLYHHNTQLW